MADFDDMGHSPCVCDHCGEPVELSEEMVDESTGWFYCPECGELNTGD